MRFLDMYFTLYILLLDIWLCGREIIRGMRLSKTCGRDNGLWCSHLPLSKEWQPPPPATYYKSPYSTFPATKDNKALPLHSDCLCILSNWKGLIGIVSLKDLQCLDESSLTNRWHCFFHLGSYRWWLKYSRGLNRHVRMSDHWTCPARDLRWG